MVEWAEFLAADPEVLGSFLGATRGPLSVVRITEELHE
jgi:hypothetical protein